MSHLLGRTDADERTDDAKRSRPNRPSDRPTERERLFFLSHSAARLALACVRGRRSGGIAGESLVRNPQAETVL